MIHWRTIPRFRIDRTTVSIFAIIIGSVGLAAAVLDYKVPELSGTFADSTPFAVKRAAIESVNTTGFAFIAVIGVIAQLVAEILGVPLERLHSRRAYIAVALGVAAAALATVLLAMPPLLQHFSDPKWRLEVLNDTRSTFLAASYTIEHDGGAPPAGAPTREAEVRQQREEAARKTINDLETLTDTSHQGDWKERTARLAQVFESGH